MWKSVLLLGIGVALGSARAPAQELPPIVDSGGWQHSATATAEAPKAQMEAAKALEARGATIGAAQAYLRLQARWPFSQEAPQALLRAAWLYYYVGDYQTTRSLLTLYGRLYPDVTPPYDSQRLWTALAEHALQSARLPEEEREAREIDRDEALERAADLLQDLYDHDRFSQLADQAVYGLGLIALEQERYERAMGHFKRLLSLYKFSPWRPEAEAQIARCLLELNPHPERTSEERLEALDRLDRAEVEAQALGRRINVDVREIREALWEIEAERWFRQGMFWWRREEYKAAAAAFGQVVQRYPSTGRASEAQDMLLRVEAVIGPQEPALESEAAVDPTAPADSEDL